MNIAKIGKTIFLTVLVSLGLWAFSLIMGWTHIVKINHPHEYTWWGYYDLCDECECWVHEDCYPGKE